MTIPNPDYRSDHVGNGATSTYSFGFKIFSKNHLKVVVLNPAIPPEVVLAVDTNYTVQNVGNPNGGTITLLGGYAPLPAGFQLAILLNPPLTQDSDVKNNDAYYLTNNENDHDRRVQQILRLSNDLARALKLPFSEAGTDDLTKLPTLVERASKMLAFDAQGRPIASSAVTLGVTASAYIQTLLDDANAAIARATLGVDGTELLDTHGADIASAATINLTTATGDYVHVTGTDTITAITLAEGMEKTVKFTGILTLAQSASLLLIGAANLKTCAGDTAVFRGEAAGVVRMIEYNRTSDPSIDNTVCNGRLTLATATPVTIANQTAKTTVYFTPYKGNRVSLFDGVDWRKYLLPEVSIAVPNQADKLYDVFAYDNAGVVALELSAAWASDTARTDALALQDGIYVKSGAATRRYLGTFRTTTAAGQTEDSFLKRYVWNYYNRVMRDMRVTKPYAWTYTTAVWREAKGETSRLDFVVGIAEDAISAELMVRVVNTNAGVLVAFSIALDTAGSGPGTFTNAVNNMVTLAALDICLSAFNYMSADDIGIGRHSLIWSEFSQAVGATTWGGGLLKGRING